MQTICTLTRYPEIFNRLRVSVENYERYVRKIVVTSGDCEVYAPGWTVIRGIEPFIYARNANIGIGAAGGGDILLINDDCELMCPILDTLGGIVAANPNIGIISPQIDGGVGGNRLQRVHKVGEAYEISKKRLAFPCVYIPEKTIELVGKLDERFVGYGFDDDDYCHRTQEAGLDLAVTGRVVVKHGYSSSFLKGMNKWEWYWSMAKMWVELKKKQIGL